MIRAASWAVRSVLVLGAVVFAFSFPGRAQDNGAKLYAANKCASCHGPERQRHMACPPEKL